MTAIDAPVLTTERLVLRGPAAADEARFVDFYMSDRARYVGGPLLRHRASLMFHAHMGHWITRGFGLWSVTWAEDTTVLGMVGGFYPDGWPERELGWILFDGAEGQGIAAEAAAAARAYAYGTLRWTGAVSYVSFGNDRSVALAQRLGATPDPDAPRPPGGDCHVFRHPGPEAPV